MAANVLPPNPSLVAILLVVKTISQPRLIFHYPPKPGEDNSRFKDIFKEGALDETSTSSTEEDGESSAGESPPLEASPVEKPEKNSPPDVEETGSASPEKKDGFREKTPEPQWNDLFAYQASTLAKMLCPPSTSHKKRVEIGLGGKVFLGQPAYAKSDGAWKKKKQQSRRTSSKSTVHGMFVKDNHRFLEGENGDLDQHAVTDEQADELQNDNTTRTYNVPEAGGNAMSGEATGDGDKPQKASLNMFHVSFVLDPPPLEYHLRVKEMYDNVVKKFTKALKWEQARSTYVANEAAVISSTIRRLKKVSGDKPGLASIYQDILAQSSLARALATLHNNITASKIAQITLTSSLSLSLQIPVPTAITSTPSSLSPQLPGLWLTTASTLPADDVVHLTASQPGSQFGLLLLTDLHTILTDINAAASPIAAPLTAYLRVSKPTKSFKQVSQSSGIPLEDVQFLASHLIYWRRARAIPPLNQRDTYIASPNADMRNLVAATSAFAKAFPSLPSLPKIMSMLSTSPRPYSALIPSVDHKEAYLNILAWLMRGGWVTQLRTFAWVRVPPDIEDGINAGNNVDATQHKTSGKKLNDESYSTTTPNLDVPNLVATSTTSSVVTATPASAKRILSPKILSSSSPTSSTASRYLPVISKYVLDSRGDESQAAWDKCIKYFDGKHAIESIAVNEGWKRKRTAELIADWDELGTLVRSRHW